MNILEIVEIKPQQNGNLKNFQGFSGDVIFIWIWSSTKQRYITLRKGKSSSNVSYDILWGDMLVPSRISSHNHAFSWKMMGEPPIGSLPFKYSTKTLSTFSPSTTGERVVHVSCWWMEEYFNSPWGQAILFSWRMPWMVSWPWFREGTKTQSPWQGVSVFPNGHGIKLNRLRNVCGTSPSSPSPSSSWTCRGWI